MKLFKLKQSFICLYLLTVWTSAYSGPAKKPLLAYCEQEGVVRTNDTKLRKEMCLKDPIFVLCVDKYLAAYNNRVLSQGMIRAIEHSCLERTAKFEKRTNKK